MPPSLIAGTLTAVKAPCHKICINILHIEDVVHRTHTTAIFIPITAPVIRIIHILIKVIIELVHIGETLYISFVLLYEPIADIALPSLVATVRKPQTHLLDVLARIFRRDIGRETINDIVYTLGCDALLFIPYKTESNLACLVVDDKITTDKIAHLLEELRHRPMRQYTRPSIIFPSIRQSIANDKIPVR